MERTTRHSRRPWRLYAHLMRLHQPTGIWLLFWPCAWGLSFASGGRPRWDLLLLFLIGAVCMRAAGCIINDLTDRQIDAQVERTRHRPLASGALSVAEAFILLGFLLVLSLAVALSLGPPIVALAAVWLIPVAAYPWMKRLTWWPQLFLGLTFNAGVLFSWLAVTGNLPLPAWLLYAAGVFWTLGYDTIYAHQDKHDDEKIGVKSTARRLAEATRPALVFFYGMMVALLVATGFYRGNGMSYFFIVVLVAIHLGEQAFSTDFDDPAGCLKAFRSNALTGAMVFIATLDI
jgi:4-hydroxybenzoate polyprenyltransferase